jgi:hypothetical protein
MQFSALPLLAQTLIPGGRENDERGERHGTKRTNHSEMLTVRAGKVKEKKGCLVEFYFILFLPRTEAANRLTIRQVLGGTCC